MWQPTLRGETTYLRPIVPSDFEALLGAASDPTIWELHSEPTRYLPTVFEEFFRGALECGGGLTILDASSDQIIGSSRYYDWDPGELSVVIGYTFLTRPYWGGAANGEIKRLMISHAFRYAKIVRFHTSPPNLRSRRALEKIGAHLEQETDVLVGGQMRPRMIFRIDAP